MFTFQPQETVLASKAINAFDDLKRSNLFQDKLQERLRRAVDLLTETSTQVNDRALEERASYRRKLNRRLANGEAEDEDSKQEYDAYQNKVDELTRKMDISIRQVIDDKTWLEDIPGVLDHVKTKAGNVSTRLTSTQFTTQQTSEDLDLREAMEPEHTQNLVQPDPSEAPTSLLDAAFSTNKTKWDSKSLTDRYSKHNDYVGWYRLVYDAKHPGENAPPMPHASLWFAAEEDRDVGFVALGSQQRNSRSRVEGGSRGNDGDEQSDSESDIEIAAERVRIRCPITLLPYRDPLASTKCPHAFEKSAILEMFKHTTEHVPLTTEQQMELSQMPRSQERTRRERQLKTPVVRCPECSVPLSEKDLRPDPVLLRKVKRVLERERRAEEAERRQGGGILDAEDDDDDDDDEAPRGTQRRNIVHVGSSPAARRQSGRFVKNERLSSAQQVESDDGDELMDE